MADIRAVLAERVAMCSSMRAAAQASFKTAEEAVTKAMAELPKDTKNARQEYDGSDAKLRSLERAHSIAARLTNEQERNMLKEMEKCKKRKKELFKLIAFEDALKEAKARRDSARKQLDDAYAFENELSLALKKLELATSLNCRAMDLVDATVAVPSEAARSRLLSRKRAVEASCQVAVDVVGKGTKLAAKVWGLPGGVAAATSQLEKLAAMVSEEMLSVAAPALVWLAAHRAAVATALEAKHDVKVDVRLPGKAGTASTLVPSQVKKTPAGAETGRTSNTNPSSSSTTSSGLGSVTITGLPAAVAACVAEVKSIKATTKTVPLPTPAVRAAVVGPKGSGVQALEMKHQCVVEVEANPPPGGENKNGTSSNKSSDANATPARAAAAAAAAASSEKSAAPVGSVARVTGLAGNVGTCCAAIQDIVRMNEPIEEVVPLEVSFSSSPNGNSSSDSKEAAAAFAASWFLSSRAARVVAVQQRTGCAVSLDRLRANGSASPQSAGTAAAAGGKKPTRDEAGAATSSSVAPPCVVTGTRAQVTSGVRLLHQLLAALARDTVFVDLGEGSLGAVFGKGGIAIQALRVAHPWCLIDVDPKQNVARIASLADEVSAELANLPRDNASSSNHNQDDDISNLPIPNQESVEAILACAAAVQALADANQRKVVDLEPSVHRQFWGAPGRSTRSAIGAIGSSGSEGNSGGGSNSQNDGGGDGEKKGGEGSSSSSSSGKSTVVLEKPAGVEKGVFGVALRGPKAGLESAAQLVRAFQANHTEERLPLECGEDEKCLLAGNDTCILRRVQQSCHVDVSLERPDNATAAAAAEKSSTDAAEGVATVGNAKNESGGKGKSEGANQNSEVESGKENSGSGDSKRGKGNKAGGGGKGKSVKRSNASANSPTSGVVATVLLAGQSEAIAKAKSLILSELNGSSDGKVVCVSVNSADLVGYAIGKQGANLKRLESTYEVTAEAVSSRLLVRLKGTDATKVAAAAADLEAILDAVPTTATLALRPPQLGSFLTAGAVDAVGAECGVAECEVVGVTGAVEGFPAVVSVSLKGKTTALRAASQVLHGLAGNPPSATVVCVLDKAQASAALNASSSGDQGAGSSSSGAGDNSSGKGNSGNNNSSNSNGRRRGKNQGKGGKGGRKGGDDISTSGSSDSGAAGGSTGQSKSLVGALASLGRGVSAAHNRLPCTIEVLALPSSSSSSSASATETAAAGSEPEGALVSLEGHPTCVAAARPLVIATLNHYFPGCFLTIDLPRWPRAGTSTTTQNSSSNREGVSSDDFEVTFGSIAAEDDVETADATDPAFELHFKELNAIAGRDALSAVASSVTKNKSSSDGGSASEALQLSLDARDGGRVTVCAGSASVAAAAVAELQRRWGGWARGKACLPLQPNQIGTVVGTKGANLKALKDSHPGLKRVVVDRGYITLGDEAAAPPSKDGVMTTSLSSRPRLLLEGSQAAVTSAGLVVQEQLDKEAAARAAAAAERAKNKVHVVEVLVNDLDALPVLIGRKGSEIKRMETQAGCTIQLLGPHSSSSNSRTPPPPQDDQKGKGSNKSSSGRDYDRASGRDRAVVRGTGTSAQAGAALVREVLAKFEAEKAARAVSAHSASVQGGEDEGEGANGVDNSSGAAAASTGIVGSSSGNDSSSCGWSDARKEALLAATPPPVPAQSQSATSKPPAQASAKSKKPSPLPGAAPTTPATAPLPKSERKGPGKATTSAVTTDSNLPSSGVADPAAAPLPHLPAPVGPAATSHQPSPSPPSSLDQAYLYDQFGASGSARLLGMLGMPHSAPLEQQQEPHPAAAAVADTQAGSSGQNGTGANPGEAQADEPNKKKNNRRKKGKNNKNVDGSNEYNDNNGSGHAEGLEPNAPGAVEASVTFGWGADSTTPVTEMPQWSSEDSPQDLWWGAGGAQKEEEEDGTYPSADVHDNEDNEKVVEVTFGSLSDNGWDLPPTSLPQSPPDVPQQQQQQNQQPAPTRPPGLDGAPSVEQPSTAAAAHQQPPPPPSGRAAKNQKKKQARATPSHQSENEPSSASSSTTVAPLPSHQALPPASPPAPPSAEATAEAALLEQFGVGGSARLMGLLFEKPGANKTTPGAPAPAPSFFSISAPAAEPGTR